MLLIVNESPWGSSLASLALRVARAIAESDDQLTTVWFSGDGVYSVLPGTMNDAGLEQPAMAWARLSEQYGTDLAVCSSAVARRLPAESGDQWAPGFRRAGLTELMTMMELSDRVVSL